MKFRKLALLLLVIFVNCGFKSPAFSANNKYLGNNIITSYKYEIPTSYFKNDLSKWKAVAITNIEVVSNEYSKNAHAVGNYDLVINYGTSNHIYNIEVVAYDLPFIVSKTTTNYELRLFTHRKYSTKNILEIMSFTDAISIDYSIYNYKSTYPENFKKEGNYTYILQLSNYLSDYEEITIDIVVEKPFFPFNQALEFFKSIQVVIYLLAGALLLSVLLMYLNTRARKRP